MKRKRAILFILLGVISLLMSSYSSCFAATSKHNMTGKIGDRSFTFLGQKYIKKGSNNVYYLDNSSTVSNKVNTYTALYNYLAKAVKKHRQSVTVNICTTNSKFDLAHYQSPLIRITNSSLKKNTTCQAYCSQIADERPFADYSRVIKSTGIQVLWEIDGLGSVVDYKKYAPVTFRFTYFNSSQPIKFAQSIRDVGTAIDEAAQEGLNAITLCMYYKGSTKNMEDVTYFNTFSGSDEKNCISDCACYLSNGNSVINSNVVKLKNKSLMVESPNSSFSTFDWHSLNTTSCKFTKKNGGYVSSNYADCAYYCTLNLHYLTKEFEDAGLPFLSSDEAIQNAIQTMVQNKERGFLGYVLIPPDSIETDFNNISKMGWASGLTLCLYNTETDYYILSTY